LDDLKRQMVQQTAASLSTAATSAVATLETLLASRDEWVKLRAAKEILDVSIRYRESLELLDRLTALEERARELSFT
jgi:hypothetical protein